MFNVAPLVNLQNDKVYAPISVKKHDIATKRLLRTRSTFSKSIMVSVAVSKLGFTDLIFVESGVKVNGAYYRVVLLQKEMLPAIRSIAGEVFIFQQDSAPAHRAQDTVALLAHKTPRFIGPDLWPLNSPDLNLVDYKIWGYFQEQMYRSLTVDVTDLKQRLVEVWSTMKQRVIDEAVNEWQKLCVS